MSNWYEAKKEDLDLSLDGRTIDIYIGDRYSGAEYVEIQISDIFQILIDHIAKTTKELEHRKSMDNAPKRK